MTQDTNTASGAAEIAATICKSVAELPDRNSPADWSDAMLVTHDELSQIVIAALASAAAPAEQPPVHSKEYLAAKYSAAALASRGQAPAGTGHEKELEDALRERDDADDFIDALLDEVLGTERAEWSSAYGRADALEEVRERITALHKPAVDRAWTRFEEATAQPAPATQQAGWRLVPLEPTDEMLNATYAGQHCSDVYRDMLAAAPTPPAQAADSVLEDATFEAVRKNLCALQRYSFCLDDDGVVRRVQDRTGNWIEFDDAHKLFDPVAVDAARKQGANHD